METIKAKLNKKLSSSQIIIISFAAGILLGALILMLPISSASGEWTSFADALFTATSALCVTGLVVQDTATYWSTFGHAVIITLIQIGGMGIVTMAIFFSALSGKRIGIRGRSIMQDSISADKVGGIVELTGFIIRMTVIFELFGAVAMAPAFCSEFGILRGIWYSVFHSISAFCNAGFDLMGVNGKFSSLTSFASSPSINIALIALILIGGIGFSTWDDMRKNKLRVTRYRMQTKVILTVTLALVILPALYFFFFELGKLPLGERVLGSLFQSVTLRTAGFNTVDLTLLSEAGIAIMIAVMLVGGSPGSTAGGMKTTTLAVMLSNAISVFRRREHTHFFGRRIPEEAVKSAATIVTMYLVLFIGGGCIISRIEGLPLLTCLFETASAVATVGLTLGITPGLGLISRAILILLMYCGRVGGLTLIFAAVSGVTGNTQRLPQEKITIG